MATHVLSGSIADLGHEPFPIRPRKIKVRVESNAAEGSIVDADTGQWLIGGKMLAVQPDGTFTQALRATGMDDRYQVVVEVDDDGTGRKRTLGSGWFELIADTDLADPGLITTSAAPPAYDIPAALAETLAARDAAEAAAASVARGEPNGTAPLDAAARLPEANLPLIVDGGAP